MAILNPWKRKCETRKKGLEIAVWRGKGRKFKEEKKNLPLKKRSRGGLPKGTGSCKISPQRGPWGTGNYIGGAKNKGGFDGGGKRPLKRKNFRTP